MLNHIDNSRVNAQAAPQQASILETLSPDILRMIATNATANSVMSLSQTSREMRAIVDELRRTNLKLINWHTYSTIALYQSGHRLRAVIRDRHAQATIARNENISESLQEFFAHSKSAEVCKALAGSPNLTSEAAQKILAGDRSLYVQEALARNSCLTSEAAQERLTKFQNARIIGL